MFQTFKSTLYTYCFGTTYTCRILHVLFVLLKSLRLVQKSCLDIALFTKSFDVGVRVQYLDIASSHLDIALSHLDIALSHPLRSAVVLLLQLNNLSNHLATGNKCIYILPHLCTKQLYFHICNHCCSRDKTSRTERLNSRNQRNNNLKTVRKGRHYYPDEG